MGENMCFDTLCNTADGVFIVDDNKRILRWNKGAEKILGRVEADVLNHECFRVVLGKSRPDKILCSQNCKVHSAALKGVPQNSFDMLTQGSEGKPLWLNVSTFAPPKGEEAFVAHIVRDITKERMKELALEQFLANLGIHGLISREKAGKQPTALNTAPQAEPQSAALSDREVEVLTLLADGYSTKSLAQKLEISHFTARNHIQNILVKLDLHSKAQAVSYAFKKGIL